MDLAIASLASGSSGNCYLIKSDRVNILVDAGISGRQISEKLKSYGYDEIPGYVLITHEHSDHVLGLGPIAKKGIKIFASKGTFQNIKSELNNCEKEIVKAGESFFIEDVKVTPFSLSHDAAEPIGYSFEKNEKCISIITDTGYVTDDCFSHMRKSNIIVLESNHDISMLRIGRYPYFLKQRILGEKGHLSNETAAKTVLSLLKEDFLSGQKEKRLVLLAHLSKENNFPQMAMATMSNILESENFHIGKDINIKILSRTNESDLFQV